uniref:Uncharacterized protein n=1 Tax=Micrurus corallinus TaxID=54390 RepID=A0A2D4GPS4_MICCO
MFLDFKFHRFHNIRPRMMGTNNTCTSMAVLLLTWKQTLARFIQAAGVVRGWILILAINPTEPLGSFLNTSMDKFYAPSLPNAPNPEGNSCKFQGPGRKHCCTISQSRF